MSVQSYKLWVLFVFSLQAECPQPSSVAGTNGSSYLVTSVQLLTRVLPKGVNRILRFSQYWEKQALEHWNMISPLKVYKLIH